MTNIVFYYSRAMLSPGNREQFLKQMEQIVEGVKQNRIKVSCHGNDDIADVCLQNESLHVFRLKKKKAKQSN